MELLERYYFDPAKDLIAENAHAKVYKAYDKLLHRDICLKLYRKEFAAGSPVVKELNRAGLFFHPNICAFYDLFELPSQSVLGEQESQPIGIMEYLNEGNIVDFLKNKDLATQKKIIKEVIKGLSYLHSLDNPHLDLKPGNILIKKGVTDYTAKITDFFNTVNLPSTEFTNSGSSHSLAYKAPELFANNGTKLDARADIWSLGVMVYEIAVGKQLFFEQGDTPETTIRKILFDYYLPSLNQVPEPFKIFVRKCLVKNVEERVCTLEELSYLLDHPVSIEPTIVEEPKLIETVEPEKENVIVSAVEPLQTFTPLEVAPIHEDEEAEKPKRRYVLPLVLTLLLLVGSAIVLFALYNNRVNTSKSNTALLPTTLPVASNMDTTCIADESIDNTSLAIATQVPSIIDTTKKPKPIAIKKSNEVVALNIPDVKPVLPDIENLNSGGSFYIDLHIPLYSKKEYALSADNVSIIPLGQNTFKIIPKVAGTFTMSVTEKGSDKVIAEKDYFVRAKPIPIASLGEGLNGGYASARLILSRLGLEASADGKSYKVKSFRMSCLSGSCEVTDSKDGFFSSTMIQYLKSIKPGEKLYFQNIKALDEDGEELTLQDFSITTF